MSRRLPLIATVVLAVVVFVAAVYVVTDNSAPQAAPAAPATGFRSSVEAAATTAPGPVPSSTAVSSGVPASQPATTAPNESLVAFVGDDYTASVGAGSAAQGFVTRVGAALGTRVVSFAVPGGGYAKHGAGDRSYAALVKDVAAAAPSVIVVTGGRNDISDYLPTVQQAAGSLFAALAKALPGATLIAVAPWWGDSDHPAELDDVAAAVRAGVTAAGGRYLDLPDPLTSHPGWMADGSDPNADGYAAIATSLVPPLRTLVSG